MFASFNNVSHWLAIFPIVSTCPVNKDTSWSISSAVGPSEGGMVRAGIVRSIPQLTKPPLAEWALLTSLPRVKSRKSISTHSWWKSSRCLVSTSPGKSASSRTPVTFTNALVTLVSTDSSIVRLTELSTNLLGGFSPRISRNSSKALARFSTEKLSWPRTSRSWGALEWLAVGVGADSRGRGDQPSVAVFASFLIKAIRASVAGRDINNSRTVLLLPGSVSSSRFTTR